MEDEVVVCASKGKSAKLIQTASCHVFNYESTVCEQEFVQPIKVFLS